MNICLHSAVTFAIGRSRYNPLHTYIHIHTYPLFKHDMVYSSKLVGTILIVKQPSLELLIIIKTFKLLGFSEKQHKTVQA